MIRPSDRPTYQRFATGALAVACLAVTLGTAACSSKDASAQGSTAAQSDAGAANPGAPGGPGARGGNRRFGEVLESLGLSDDQKAQIRKIMADARTQARSQTDPDQRRATMRAAFTKIGDVLTPAQRDAFKAKMQAVRNRNGAPTGQPAGQGTQ